MYELGDRPVLGDAVTVTRPDGVKVGYPEDAAVVFDQLGEWILDFGHSTTTVSVVEPKKPTPDKPAGPAKARRR